MKTFERTTALGLSALAALWSTGVSAGVASTQIDEVFNNQTFIGEFTVRPIFDVYAFAVANDDAAFPFIQNGKTWDTVIVDIEIWDAGFAFDGAEGWSAIGTLPDTTGTFATFFGAGFSQAIVYWDIGAATDPILDGSSQDGWFFSTQFPQSPFVVFDINGSDTGGDTNLTVIPVPAAGFMFGSGLIALLGMTRRKTA